MSADGEAQYLYSSPPMTVALITLVNMYVRYIIGNVLGSYLTNSNDLAFYYDLWSN